jgi:phosphonate transport system substrate-binding protein
MAGTLRFAIAPAVYDQDLQRALDDLCDALGRAVRANIRGYVAKSYAEVAFSFARGEADIGWLPPVPALIGCAKGLLVPIAVPVRNGREASFSVVVSREGSAFRSLSDLAGAKVAWVDRDSAAGYVVPRARLITLGIDPSATFSSEQFLGSHMAVVEAVRDGRVDVGATFSSAAAGLQVMEQIGPIPEDVLAVSTRLSPVMAESIQRALLDNERTPDVVRAGRALFRADELRAPIQRHLDPLAKMLEKARSSPAG